jgi:hypothetical protein
MECSRGAYCFISVCGLLLAVLVRHFRLWWKLLFVREIAKSCMCCTDLIKRPLQAVSLL